jgi:integrase
MKLPAVAVVGDLQIDDARSSAERYAREAQSSETRRAYAGDWKHYQEWVGARLDLADVETVGLYLAALADDGLAVTSIERRLAGVLWFLRMRGTPVDRSDPRISAVLAGIVRKRGRPAKGKEPVFADELSRMVGLVGHDIRGLRDRALLLVGFAGALRRCELVGLDLGRDQTTDGRGWGEVYESGLLLVVRGKHGWREVEVGLAADPALCPVKAWTAWTKFARLAHGPAFRRIVRSGRVLDARLGDRYVADLVKGLALQAGVGEFKDEEARKCAYAGHSLRKGLASSADASEFEVQGHLRHASPEMLRRYRKRRTRFSRNMTRAAGL